MSVLKFDLNQQRKRVKENSIDEFFELLTPSRLLLLRLISIEQPESLNSLSQIAKKNQGNVLRDVRILESLGLIKLVSATSNGKRSFRPVIACKAVHINFIKSPGA